MATSKKTSTKTTTSKKVTEKSSATLNDSLLKKSGIDELGLEDLLKFAKKEKVEIPNTTDESDRVNIVLPVLAHLAQKEDLLLGFGILDILNDGYGFLRNPDTDDNNDDIYVSGNLGDSYMGLLILKNKINFNNSLKSYFINQY